MVNYNIEIENAKLLFKNFSGEQSKFNRKGDRNFSVIIEDPAEAERLAADGWNIRVLNSRDEEEDPLYIISVSVSFDPYPPKIVLVTSSSKTEIDEESVDILDTADIRNVDVIIKSYNWEVNGKTGVKGYLKTMYVTIEEDKFAAKYEHL